MATTAPATKKSTKGRKSAAIALAIVGVAGLSLASAAQLNVTSTTLSAGSVAVNACDTDAKVNLTYTTGFTAPDFTVATIVVNGVDNVGCVGATIAIAVNGTTPLAPQTITTAGGTAYTFAAPAGTTASALANVAVIIHG